MGKQRPEASDKGGLPDDMRQFVLTAPACLVLVNTCGQVTLLNDDAARLFLYDRRELEGLPLTQILPERGPGPLEPDLLAIPPTHPQGYHLRTRRRDGSTLILEVSESQYNANGAQYRCLNLVNKTATFSRFAWLHQSDTYKDLVIDEAPVLISYIDKSFRYRYVNRQYEIWIKLAKEECIGRHVWDLTGDEAFLRLRPRMDRALRGESLRYHDRYPYPALGLRDVETAYLPHRDESGEVAGFFVVVNDITLTKHAEREILEAKDQSFKKLLDAMPYLAWLADSEGTIRFLNRAWLETTGLTLGQGEGQSWVQAIAPRQQARVLAEWQESLRGDVPFSGTASLATRQGLRCYRYLATKVYGFPDQPISWLCILIDIDDSIQLQDKLREEKEAAVKASSAKSLFVANMSHEMRTPLAVILNFAELLEEDEPLTSEGRHCLHTIRRNASHLLELINNILDLSRIERDRMAIKSAWFSLGEEMQALMETFAAKAHQKGLHIELKHNGRVPAQVKSDIQLIRQVLINLLDNAIKFTSRGFVRVELASTPLPSHEARYELCFTVHDSGIGINPAFQTSIFEVFAQADESHSRLYGGSGLGLTLSKRIAELLQGKLFLAESHVGEGSTFVFKIPVLARDGQA